MRFGTGSDVRRQDLERDLTLQDGVGRSIDFAHTACAEQGADFERAETCPSRQGHVRVGGL
jgi:hypothetical protein